MLSLGFVFKPAEFPNDIPPISSDARKSEYFDGYAGTIQFYGRVVISSLQIQSAVDLRAMIDAEAKKMTDELYTLITDQESLARARRS